MNPTNKVRRWWVGGVVLAFCFLALDSDVRMGEYWRPNKSRLGNGPSAPQLDPASPTGYALGQRRYIMPENGMDSYHWIMQTQRMLAGHGLRSICWVGGSK